MDKYKEIYLTEFYDKCKACGRQFAFPSYPNISDSVKEKCQLIFTGNLKFYDKVIPESKHHAGKKLNQNIERLFLMMGQRVSRVVKKAYSFPKNGKTMKWH